MTAPMKAFVKTVDGLYKIYDHGSDWQVIGPKNYERWYSTWQHNLRASLNRAVQDIPYADSGDLCIMH